MHVHKDLFILCFNLSMYLLLCVIRDQGLTEDPSRDPVCVLYLATYHSYYGMTVVCVLISA